MERLKHVYLLWNGRASRKTYWIFSTPIVALFLLVEFIFTNLNEYIYYAILVLVIYTSLMINIKRAHDRNRTGLFSLLLLKSKRGRWFKYNFALQKKKSYPLLANADTGLNRLVGCVDN